MHVVLVFVQDVGRAQSFLSVLLIAEHLVYW